MHASKILQMFFHLNLPEYHNQSCILQIIRNLISMFIDVFYLFCNVCSVFPSNFLMLFKFIFFHNIVLNFIIEVFISFAF